MKKILFASAFALMGIFAMANETASTKENIEKKAETNQSTTSVDCIKVSYSCGASASICDFKGTTKQLVNMVMAQDDLICGE